MTNIAAIKFRCSEKLEECNTGDLKLRWRDIVIGEAERGIDMGIVMVEPHEASDVPASMRRVMRKATTEDLKRNEQNKMREKEAHRFCKEAISEKGLPMKLTDVLYCFDGIKIIFTFTAEGKVDFRELVKTLVQKYHARIEMRQIGVRDEAKRVGGIGICGRDLCCSLYLREFMPVTVKMAKVQSLVFNPQKASGYCGRLKCCLAYEFDSYAHPQKEKDVQ